MASGNDILNKKWNLVKEQLISLCAFNKLSKGNEDFIKFFSEDFALKDMNAHILTSICYFLLGIINSEERNKLIFWPLTNIQSHSKFRKGVSSIVIGLQQKYPWAHIEKLPESHFLNPHGHHPRVVDFILKLSNLAIHITLNDPEVLIMHSGKNVNSKEINIMTEFIAKAKEYEELKLRNCVFPETDFEEIKNEVCDKCIYLRKENDELQQHLSSLIKHAVSEGLLPTNSESHTEEIIRLKNEKLQELNEINEELSKYFDVSQELVSKIKALKNPMSLSTSHFGCDNSLSGFIQTTYRVCDDLQQFYKYIISKHSSKEEEERFYEQLKSAKNIFLKEEKILQSFLSKILPLTQKV